MKILARDLKHIICIISTVVLLAGCGSLGARLSRPPEDLPESAAMAEARVVLAGLSNQNRRLTNFKGLGKIKLRYHQKTRLDETIAWVASETAKLNIVVLVSGHPVIKMASDGKWFYYYEAREGRPFYKKMPASDANLKRITGIPIKTADIIDLLAGRIPLREHHSAALERPDSGKDYVLVLKRRWWGVTEKIRLDETKSTVHSAEFYSRSGSLVYRARFDAMQTIDGYRVPALLSISNGDGVDMQLVINRYWADVDVSASMFVLNPPE